jgi:molybdate transport system substrate-binding protein
MEHCGVGGELPVGERKMSRIFAAVVAFGVVFSGVADGAELKIFGSRVTKMVIAEIGPQFEQATGYKPVVVSDVAAVMKRRIEQGESFDLAVLVDFQTDELINAERLIAASRADVMKAGIGVAVRRGAPKPDISTVEAFKQTLLAAKSVTFLKEGGSTRHLKDVFDRLGITEALKAKTTQPMTESVSEMVADGEAELGIIVIPNILSVPGAELVGPLPPELQGYITFTAAASARSPNQDAAAALIKLLTSPSTHDVIRSKGMEPG